ncbi:class I SAM-dependent methyltransferase [Lutibaculum baratangense]|uniref:SAM-dependent methyltransferase n=1 Tax=Lutibaculum baratangense AMV1 TaxID=631454 RepID=V4RAY9_9HYPH|nr:methyltransferase [Lutibaculum baratangense]ESR22569.1 SAM-dependent methyltransferase [Lutibaculum baratangense AMV1]
MTERSLTARSLEARRAFVEANTLVLPVPHCPEIRLHVADEALPLWEKTEEELGEAGLPPPFWAFAWAGGQALARYILDNPETVSGRRVLDLGAGSGLVAIAAMKAGAASALAADTDPWAEAAVALNASLNGVAVTSSTQDMLDGGTEGFDLVAVGDLFYERPLAARVLAFLDRAMEAGAGVLVGDPDRTYLPRERLRHLALYEVPTPRALEDMEIKKTSVWALEPKPVAPLAPRPQ